MDQWEDYFDRPSGGRLGVLVAMLDIGSLASFWMVPYFADTYGRKAPIIIGCITEAIGVLLGAFANGQGSQYCTRGRF